MTDRFNGLLVTLDRDIREDDAQDLIGAIMMMKGVISVRGNVTDSADHLIRQRFRCELFDKLMKVYEDFDKKE